MGSFVLRCMLCAVSFRVWRPHCRRDWMSCRAAGMMGDGGQTNPLTVIVGCKMSKGSNKIQMVGGIGLQACRETVTGGINYNCGTTHLSWKDFHNKTRDACGTFPKGKCLKTPLGTFGRHSQESQQISAAQYSLIVHLGPQATWFITYFPEMWFSQCLSAV